MKKPGNRPAAQPGGGDEHAAAILVIRYELAGLPRADVGVTGANGLLETVLKGGAAGTPQHIDIETRNQD